MLFTSHGTRITDFVAVRFSVGDPGVCAVRSRRKPPSGPLRPPASHCFPVHHCSPLFGENIVLRQCPRAARTAAPAALRLVPLRRTPNEPMLRKGNFLYCVDNTSRTFPQYYDCGPIEAPRPARLMRTSTRFPQSRDSGLYKPRSTSRAGRRRLDGAE